LETKELTIVNDCLQKKCNANIGLYGQTPIKHCKKHYLFALSEPDKPLLIIAVLHEQMDLINRLKNRLRLLVRIEGARLYIFVFNFIFISSFGGQVCECFA